MTEQNYPAGPAMVKIDGTRVRAIREQKGLTQLYVATVVEVTTDTVSRWENKRYPTIKKENGLKLAEALEVELSEILDSGDQEAPPAAPPPTIPATIVSIEPKETPVGFEFVGQAESSRKVEIRARVDGFLDSADTRSTMACLRALGASIEEAGDGGVPIADPEEGRAVELASLSD